MSKKLPDSWIGDPGLPSIAQRNSFAEFLAYIGDEPVDVNCLDRYGSTPLRGATGNNDPDARYKITSWLLDRGADPLADTDRDSSVLHNIIYCISVRKPWFEQDLELLQRLLDAGADVNRSIPRDGRVFEHLCHCLNPRYPEHKHVYDMFFARDDIDFKTISKRSGASFAAYIIRCENSWPHGQSPLEGWIREYLARQGHTADEVDTIINTRGIYADED